MKDPKTLIVDLNEYADRITGKPPKNFRDKILLAQTIYQQVEEHGADEDVFLLCALAHYMNEDRNPAAFIARARQVVNWASGEWRKALDAPEVPGGLNLPQLENKLTEIGRVLAQMLFQDENFILLLTNRDFTTWATSVNRTAAIKHLREFLKAAEGSLRE